MRAVPPFIPRRVELVIVPSMREEDWVQRYERAGVTLVEVPEDDPDHNQRRGKPKPPPESSLFGEEA